MWNFSWLKFRQYVFSVMCRTSAVHLLFTFCFSAAHLLFSCFSSHVLPFCLSSTGTCCTSLTLLKFLYSSPAFHLGTLRRSQDVLQRHNPVPLLSSQPYKITLFKRNNQPISEFFLQNFCGSKLHSKSDFPLLGGMAIMWG